ncbi:DJ-1/PfpI family protein [Streptomyces sp. NPDC058964]|uniref:DJ-1/PfpI family protein n=1 Tax=Streptomyces sp. NPDC058964 TaxID=3346681 RepID=UPI0036CE4389
MSRWTVLLAQPVPVEPLDVVPIVRVLEKCPAKAFDVEETQLSSPTPPRRSGYDIVVVPGGEGARATYADTPVMGLLDEHVRAGRRTYTVCSGAFVPAARGLLEGRTVATHTGKAAALAASGLCTARQGLVRDGAITSVGGTAVGHVKALALALQIVADHEPGLLPALWTRLDIDPSRLPQVEVVR